MSITKALELEERDWREIYYAVDTKLKAIEEGKYGDHQTDEELAAWAAHLRTLKEKIEDLNLVL